MSRPKGSVDRAPQAERFVRRVEAMLKRADPSNDCLERLACRFIVGEDTKVAFGVWSKLVEYKLGKPTQPLEHSGTINYTEVLTKMRARKNGGQHVPSP